MDNKEKNRKKKIKVILGICISVFLFLGGGLLAYIHKVDTDTLGEKNLPYMVWMYPVRMWRRPDRPSGKHFRIKRLFSGRMAVRYIRQL